ncbi:MAG TPA: F0F1 ATP synthase subunit A [Acidobacteriota bacterium]|nr:F0F1 ATP synthase subunit A [Acidobacteriota bacterium]
MIAIQITPDEWILWHWAVWPAVKINATIFYSWVVMAILALGSRLITWRLSSGPKFSRLQNLLEVLVTGMRSQIRDVSRQDPGRYLPFVGTLFLFIATANLLAVVPGYRPPTASLSTTAALATCVFVAVPLYGIASKGLGGYLKQYVRPTPFMLPFNVIGEFSRTLALAVRLYGNIMSGTVIAAILIGFVPLFVPVLMQLLGLLTGMIQAYIFAVLAMVYIASATRIMEGKQETAQSGTVPQAVPANGERSEDDSSASTLGETHGH